MACWEDPGCLACALEVENGSDGGDCAGVATSDCAGIADFYCCIAESTDECRGDPLFLEYVSEWGNQARSDRIDFSDFG